MNKKRNILLTGIGLASNNRLYNLLLGINKNIENLFVCGSDITVYENEKNITIFKAPKNDDPTYLNFLLYISKNNQITDIIPFIDSEVAFLSKNYTNLITNGITPWVAENDTIINCIDKWECFQIAKKYSPQGRLISSTNEFFHAINSLGYPDLDVVCRPSSGPNGSGKGFRVISSRSKEWHSNFYDTNPSKKISPETYSTFISEAISANKLPPILVTEYLPGQEYSCYICANKGILIDCVIHKKNEYESGTTNTGQADVIESNEIELVCKILTERFKLHLLNNIQLKRDQLSNLKLIEINPRAAGTILLAEIAGHNLFARAYSIVSGSPFNKKSFHKKKSIIRRQVDFFIDKSFQNILVEFTSKDSSYFTKYKKFLSSNFINSYDIYIFDLDNTLFDEWSYLSQCTISFLDKINIHSVLTKKKIINQLHQYYIDNGNDLLFNNVLLKFGCKQESVSLFLNELRTSTSVGIHLIDEAEELLKELRNKNKNIFIVTDGNEQQQKNKYRLLNLSRYVLPAGFICAEKYGGKSKKECAESILLGKINKTICVFGDSIFDLEFAKNLSADFFKFEWSLNKSLF